MAVNEEDQLQELAHALRKDREERPYDNRSPVRDDVRADVEFVRETLLKMGDGKRVKMIDELERE